MTDNSKKRLVCVETFRTYSIERTQELHQIRNDGVIIGKIYRRNVVKQPKFTTYTIVSLREWMDYEIEIGEREGYCIYRRSLKCEKEKVSEIYEKLKSIDYKEILKNSLVGNKVNYDELLKVIDEFITNELK